MRENEANNLKPLSIEDFFGKKENSFNKILKF